MATSFWGELHASGPGPGVQPLQTSGRLAWIQLQPPEGPAPGICLTVGPGWWGRCAGRWPSPVPGSGSACPLGLSCHMSVPVPVAVELQMGLGGGWRGVEVALVLQEEAGVATQSSLQGLWAGPGLQSCLATVPLSPLCPLPGTPSPWAQSHPSSGPPQTTCGQRLWPGVARRRH